MKTWETPKGKKIETYYSGRNIAIRFAGGGELPECLSGTYTNINEVEAAINRYLATKTKDDK